MKSAFGPARSAAHSRVFVVASGQLLTNPFARAGNPRSAAGGHGDRELQILASPYARAHLTASILVVKNTLTWFCSDPDLLDRLDDGIEWQ